MTEQDEGKTRAQLVAELVALRSQLRDQRSAESQPRAKVPPTTDPQATGPLPLIEEPPCDVAEEYGAAQAEHWLRLQRDLALGIGASRDVVESARLVLDTALRLTGMDSGGVYLRDDTSGALELVTQRGLTEAFVAAANRYEADAPATRLVMTGRPAYTQYDDLATSPTDAHRAEGLRSIAVVPIQHEGVVLACLNVASHQRREISPLARRVLETMAAETGNGIARIMAEQALRRSEAQLLQSQKMEAIGTLAGGVAHDINNVLGAIMGAASLLETELEPGDERASYAADILTACRRGRDLTRNLLGFARKGKYVKKAVSLNDAAGETQSLLARTMPKKIRITTELDSALAPVEGDATQLKQVLMNVCLNAVEAMAGQGSLQIRTRNVHLEGLRPMGTIQLGPGHFVEVEVTDSGAGMAPAVVQRAFEPFFTTKPKGKGTGLGLAMVYGTVRNHDGAVTIASQPGLGTQVTILLPAAAPTLSAATPSVPAPLSRPGRGGILLVDDEVMIRRTGERLLRKLGYTVFLADNGARAVEVYRESQAEISLVLLDLQMPVMDGPEALAELRAINPKLRILIASGYGKDERIDDLLTSKYTGFIQKPFELAVLSQKVAAAMC